MLKHNNLKKWERRLKSVFDDLDDFLEDKYGELYPLHPNRAKRGDTANKSYDGLFDVGASFSLGIGSKEGPGYVVSLRLATLDKVDADIRKKIEDDVESFLKKTIEEIFSERDLDIKRDGTVLKIYGDLSLGSLK